LHELQRHENMNLIETDDWGTWTPRAALSPQFEAVKGENPVLRISGGGNAACVGCWSKIVPVVQKQAYKFTVRFRASGIEAPLLHVTSLLVYLRENVTDDGCATNFIESYTPDGDQFVGEQTFETPLGITRVKIQLQFKFSSDGAVEWTSVELEETSPIPEKNAIVAAFRGAPPSPSTPGQSRQFWSEQLDLASQLPRRPDLVLLPEAIMSASIPGLGPNDLAEAIPDGPTFEMLAGKAREHGFYVCTTLWELDPQGVIYNTAVLIDREGTLAGKYCKTHLHYPEVVIGITPGDAYPVFETDFGIVGIIICYDSWFVEPAKVLALQGAELVLFPNAGYDERVAVTRAIDNNVYVAISSLNNPAMLLCPDGWILEKQASTGFAVSEMDLNERPSPHPNAGGNMMSAGAGKLGKRNARSLGVYAAIGQLVRR
jgi:predicted amidohydrolase